jgi:hypothetical protein
MGGGAMSLELREKRAKASLKIDKLDFHNFISTSTVTRPNSAIVLVLPPAVQRNMFQNICPGFFSPHLISDDIYRSRKLISVRAAQHEQAALDKLSMHAGFG